MTDPGEPLHSVSLCLKMFPSDVFCASSTKVSSGSIMKLMLFEHNRRKSSCNVDHWRWSKIWSTVKKKNCELLTAAFSPGLLLLLPGIFLLQGTLSGSCVFQLNYESLRNGAYSFNKEGCLRTRLCILRLTALTLLIKKTGLIFLLRGIKNFCVICIVALSGTQYTTPQVLRCSATPLQPFRIINILNHEDHEQEYHFANCHLHLESTVVFISVEFVNSMPHFKGTVCLWCHI